MEKWFQKVIKIIEKSTLGNLLADFLTPGVVFGRGRKIIICVIGFGAAKIQKIEPRGRQRGHDGLRFGRSQGTAEPRCPRAASRGVQ